MRKKIEKLFAHIIKVKLNKKKTRMTTIKKYCKICYDSDKPESEYTSHCVKGRNGKVECPTLLKVKCRLCDQFGHTVKYCPDTKNLQSRNNKTWENKTFDNKNLDNKNLDNKKTLEKEKEKEKQIQKSNFYDLLDESDEEPDKEEPEQKQKQEKSQIKKRWVDYDSDSDDEVKPCVLQLSCIPIPPILRRRSSHTSQLAYDSLDESYELTDQRCKNPPFQNPVLKRSPPHTFYDSSDEEQTEQM